MATTTRWVTRWKMEISAEPVLPGVWRRKRGGHVVRARVTNPKTGRQQEILKALPDVLDPKRALAWLTAERDRIRAGKSRNTTSIPTWKSFAAQLFASKVDDRSISTASGRKKWERILRLHLFKAFWAHYFLDRVSHADLVEWRAEIAKLGWKREITRGDTKWLSAEGDTYSPNTLNDWLNIARVVWKAAKHKFQLMINPMDGIEDFATDTHRTYTDEEPNSLLVAETRDWLAGWERLYPQHYAMVFLGLVLGKRVAELRPLRRNGPHADVDFKTGAIKFRRSNTEPDVIEDYTKSKRDQKLYLPKEVLDVICWHIDTQLKTPYQRDSDLLFPNDDGGLRSRSCLDKPFAAVTASCGLTKKITPRALRRTFKDLAREAGLDAVIGKAISNHQTDAMHLLYSTAGRAEVQRGLAKVVSLTERRAKRRGRAN